MSYGIDCITIISYYDTTEQPDATTFEETHNSLVNNYTNNDNEQYYSISLNSPHQHGRDREIKSCCILL